MARPTMAGSKAAPVAAATTPATPTPAPAPRAGILSAVQGILSIVRYYGERTTNAVLAYITAPEKFAELTGRQWVNLHNAACSLVQAGTPVDLGSKRKGSKRDPNEADFQHMETSQPVLLAALAALQKAGKTPRLVWSHQSFPPVVWPGSEDPRLGPMYVTFAEMQEAGSIEADVSFVDAVKAADAAGLIVQRGSTGGYVLADAKLAEVSRAERKETRKARPKAAKVDLAARFARIAGHAAA